MTNETHKPQTGYVTAEGDDIYYEVRGRGQPLLMIHGGADARIYASVAAILADEYRVITYDRRGNLRSTRHAPQNFEMSQQSRDALAVLNAAGESRALVFGNSGGAVIALDLAKTQPQAIEMVVVHEPPVLRVLPDREKWLRFFAGLYRMSFRYGANLAMLRFTLSLGIPLSAFKSDPRDSGEDIRKYLAEHPGLEKQRARNTDFFLKHEMLGFTNYLPDVEMIRANAVNVVMAVGQVTLAREKFYGRTAPILADMLGCKLAVFPGHHISYMDMPQEWASVLRAVLHEGVNQLARAAV